MHLGRFFYVYVKCMILSHLPSARDGGQKKIESSWSINRWCIVVSEQLFIMLTGLEVGSIPMPLYIQTPQSCTRRCGMQWWPRSDDYREWSKQRDDDCEVWAFHYNAYCEMTMWKMICLTLNILISLTEFIIKLRIWLFSVYNKRYSGNRYLDNNVCMHGKEVLYCIVYSNEWSSWKESS